LDVSLVTGFELLEVVVVLQSVRFTGGDVVEVVDVDVDVDVDVEVTAMESV